MTLLAGLLILSVVAGGLALFATFTSSERLQYGGGYLIAQHRLDLSILAIGALLTVAFVYATG